MYLVYTLTSLFEFGKHTGKTIQDIILSDPTYINWCLNEFPEFILSAEADDYNLALWKNHAFCYLFNSVDLVNGKYKAIEAGAKYKFVRNENNVI